MSIAGLENFRYVVTSAGRTTTMVEKVIGIRRWVRDSSDPYAMRAEMSDGARTAKLDLRPMLTDFLRKIDLQRVVREAVAEAMRTAKQSL